jgi:transcriptional regulator with XRE-family HTH domain
MPTSPSSSVEAARKALGLRLREIRREAGIPAAEIAHRAGWHPSKSSRLENGVTPASAPDIREWCRICGANDQAADLIAASLSADTMYVEWRRLQKSGLRRIQESYVPLYERTRVFHIYCSNVIPGFFQTPAYATALLAEITQYRPALAKLGPWRDRSHRRLPRSDSRRPCNFVEHPWRRR